jgi:four helix bundle protein
MKNGTRVLAGDDLDERLLDFSARAGKVVDALPNTRVGRHVAGQLVRCSSSPGANYSEACGAESTKDFVHKLGVSFKEMRETRYWLRYSIKSVLLPEKRLAPLLDECEQLCRIIAQSIITTKKRIGIKRRPES